MSVLTHFSLKYLKKYKHKIFSHMNIRFNTSSRIIAILELTENEVALEQRASIAFRVWLNPSSSSEELGAF